MRVLLLLLVCVVSVCESHCRITSKHVGALNHRMPNKHMLGNEKDEAQWLSQKLDHFAPSDSRVWQQKYYVNDTYWGGTGSPVFFMLGGEGPVSPAYLTGHFILNEYAQQFQAMMVVLEHRFYGDSIPLNDSSTANLKYLSSQQALADAAYFHEVITQKYGAKDSKWIVFGGSYSGALSAWAREKYPLLFTGAISASAPVLAQTDFPEYFQVVAASVGAKCSNIIKQANQVVSKLLSEADGLAQLSKDFNTCAPLTNSTNDIVQFLGALSDPFAGIVQYNDDNNAYQPFDITAMCQRMSEVPDAYTALVNFVNAYNERTESGCIETRYDVYIQEMQATSAGRSWYWQTCSEYGYYQTGESKEQPFSPSISLQSFLQQCVDIFGIPDFQPDVAWTNTYYGAKNLVTSNTFFTNGQVDPWHILGITSNPPPNTQYYFIAGTAHCADLYPARDQDLPGLTLAREMQVQLIKVWLGLPQAKEDNHILIAQQ